MEAIYLKEVHEKNNILKLFFKFVQGQILNDVHMKIKYINLILIIYIYIYMYIRKVLSFRVFKYEVTCRL